MTNNMLLREIAITKSDVSLGRQLRPHQNTLETNNTRGLTSTSKTSSINRIRDLKVTYNSKAEMESVEGVKE